MTEREQGGADETKWGGDRRGRDRRKRDRRREDRRAPTPPWRRPWAFAGYGVLAALAAVLLLQGVGVDPEAGTPEPAGERPGRAAPLSEAEPIAQPGVPPRDAYAVADYERLLAEGADAAGARVRTTLYCSPLRSVSLSDVQRVHPSITALVDQAGRVPAAECRWGREGRAQDFLLLVPPPLAEEFARSPEVQLGFVPFREVRATVEWIGRSDALALRTAGVLRGLERAEVPGA